MSDYAPLRFRYNDFIQEIQAIQKLAGSFFQKGSESIFHELVNPIRQLCAGHRSPQNAHTAWGVSLNRPLRTVTTNEYERGDRRGGRRVIGEVTWQWELGRSGAQSERQRNFIVVGNASVRLRICDAQNAERELAMWRIECGAHDAPGCYFHTQVLGDDTSAPFPRDLPVPRLPTLFVTPMSAIEFLLAELFQDRWQRSLVGSKHSNHVWRTTQRRYLTQLLSWKLQQVTECDGTSPWIALKNAKPRSGHDLFLPQDQ